MRVIVSDTSPIRYLVLIGEAELLEKLYGRVYIPEAVYKELQRPQTPEVVRRWIEAAPNCLQIISEHAVQYADAVSSELDRGERAAIAIALELKADLVLMDERAGIEEARRLGLNATGTLGVLARAAERGMIELAAVVAKLQATNFRVQPEILQRLLREQN